MKFRIWESFFERMLFGWHEAVISHFWPQSLSCYYRDTEKDEVLGILYVGENIEMF